MLIRPTGGDKIHEIYIDSAIWAKWVLVSPVLSGHPCRQGHRGSPFWTPHAFFLLLCKGFENMGSRTTSSHWGNGTYRSAQQRTSTWTWLGFSSVANNISVSLWLIEQFYKQNKPAELLRWQNCPWSGHDPRGALTLCMGFIFSCFCVACLTEANYTCCIISSVLTFFCLPFLMYSHWTFL